ncbi:MAG: CaiB/BaiF CoA-transferase family protein, partial [Deinococcales bacterium]
MTGADASLPLTGVTVLEFSQAVLGPAAGLVLADLGAEVVRIEPAPDGDPTRRLRGFGMGYYPFFNRNKKSVVLDVKDPRGYEAVERLVGRADVLIENFAPGTMDRLRLGYDELSERFPRLVYCSLKGFLPGPYERRTALDEVVQIMSGLAYMTGPQGRPLRAGASVVDIMTGVYGAMGAILALRERDRTGRGTLVRSALFETAAFIMGHHMAYAVASGEPVPPMPERVSAWAVYQQFTTADGAIVFIGVTSDKQ